MIDAIQIEWIYAGGAFAAGVLLALLFFFPRLLRLERENADLNAQVQSGGAALEHMGNQFKTTAQEALRLMREDFLNQADAKFKDAQKDSAHDLEKRHKAIADLVDPVNKALSQMDEKLQHLEKARLTAYTELQTHLQTMTQDQVKLRQETATLVQALRSPSTRGQWGEMQLRRCLEMAGMQKGVHFEEQISANSGQRPDVIIKLSGGQCIVIDAKAPIEGYLDALKEGISEAERDAGLDRHARHVRDHLKKLGSKSYWEQFDTPEFVVMFLPGESYFSAALERDPGLIEAGVDQKVIPATPTTLISLLKAVMYGWKQEQLAQNAREISALGAELYERIRVFSGHMEKVGRGLGGAMESYNKAISSLESRVLVTARKFEDLHAAPGGKALNVIEPVDHSIRQLNAPETVENAEDDGEVTKKRA